MPRISLWSGGAKTDNYTYIDRAISEWMGISGTAVFVHLYLGTHDQSENATSDSPTSVTSIQDVLFLENRDRKYSEEVFEIRGIYNVGDIDYNLLQFGLFLQGDVLFLEVHMNDTFHQLGRKLMAGDVLELPHQRDDMGLDPTKPATNKYYVIDDVNRSSSGYSPTWYPHILRLKCSPLSASEEYSDILDKQIKDPFGFDDGKLRDILTSVGMDLDINEEIVEEAKANVRRRNFETRHMYVVPGEGGFEGSQNPWIFAGDGNPPNGALPIGAGNSFPQGATNGDYYLRTDYSPQALFLRIDGRWKMQEQDYREAEWSAAHRILKEFINQSGTAQLNDGTEIDIKQGLHKAVKPRADF